MANQESIVQKLKVIQGDFISTPRVQNVRSVLRVLPGNPDVTPRDRDNDYSFSGIYALPEYSEVYEDDNSQLRNFGRKRSEMPSNLWVVSFTDNPQSNTQEKPKLRLVNYTE